MSTDRYNSPLSERYASKEMQYIFFTGYEIPYLEKTLDRACRDRNGIRSFREWKTGHHTGADR